MVVENPEIWIATKMTSADTARIVSIRRMGFLSVLLEIGAGSETHRREAPGAQRSRGRTGLRRTTSTHLHCNRRVCRGGYTKGCWLKVSGDAVASPAGGLHLHARPLFQQGKRGGVVEFALAFFFSHLVDFIHRFEGGQLDAQFARSFQHEMNVLVHEAKRKVSGKITPHDERRLVVNHPR